jgi:surface polysaccharide O-acyltransferase-like enzyme
MPKQYWISNLRIFATICVIFIHTSGGALIKFGNIGASTWWSANIISGIGRFTVPVFVMISGALLLGKEIDLVPFLKKRFLRVWVPFSVWAMIYVAYHNIFENNPISLKNSISQYFTGGNGQYGHLWFIYMLLGLYLFTPIINYFVVKASETEVLYLLIICFISTTLFLFIKQFFKINIILDISNFGSYLGYYVAGFYFKNKSFYINKYWFLVFFIIGFLITIYGTFWLSAPHAKYNGYFYQYFSPNSVVMSIAIFLFFKEAFNNEYLPIISQNLDKASFGIYLGHLLVINILSRKFGLNWAWQQPFGGIIMHGLLTTLITFCFVRLISKLPLGKWIVG